MPRGLGKTQIAIIEKLDDPTLKRLDADRPYMSLARLAEVIYSSGATASHIEVVRRSVASLVKQEIVKKSRYLVRGRDGVNVRAWELTGKVRDVRPEGRNPAIRGRRAPPPKEVDKE